MHSEEWRTPLEVALAPINLKIDFTELLAQVCQVIIAQCLSELKNESRIVTFATNEELTELRRLNVALIKNLYIYTFLH